MGHREQAAVSTLKDRPMGQAAGGLIGLFTRPARDKAAREAKMKSQEQALATKKLEEGREDYGNKMNEFYNGPTAPVVNADTRGISTAMPYDYRAGLAQIDAHEAAAQAPVAGLYTMDGLHNHAQNSQNMGSDLEHARALIGLQNQPNDPYGYLKR